MDTTPTEIIYCDGGNSENHPLYSGFKNETTVLKQGTILKSGALALPCDISYERDIAVRLRDGVTNESTVSSLEKFEALDPAYWCLHGYAIASPEGNTYVNSVLDGQDGYDLVEWLAAQPWCNQKVSFAGNSWLSQTQLFVGTEQPPHLACLAPWEGWNDLYNDDTRRVGIPTPDFQKFLLDTCSPSLDKTEDIVAMTHKYPLWNQYWQDRQAKLERITVPVYVVASWTNKLHTRGTFKGFIHSSSDKKWLRVHNSHEWPDLYYPQNVEDLRKFFDFYLKGIKNDWEFTPKVRLTTLNPGGDDIVNRPENQFPLQREIPTKVFLDAAKSTLYPGPGPGHKTVEFDAKASALNLDYTFAEPTELTGFFPLQLWVEAVDTEDLDLYSKLDSNGELLESTCIDAEYLAEYPAAERKKARDLHKQGDPSVDLFFSRGSTGRLRVSHRELDKEKSLPGQPVYTQI